jgi:glucosamine--fructose-6-phosphate aminotransferase (isomerizing)
VIPLHAGIENAVAATKTYTSSLAALAMLSCSLDRGDDRADKLKQIPAMMSQALTNMKTVIDRTERYRYMEHCAVLGRGFNYATAFEVALKVKELSQVVAEPYSSADFRHGPIATVTHGFPVILVAPTGAVSDDMTDLIEHLNRLKAEMIVISDNAQVLSNARLALPLPVGLPEWLSPLVAVLPGQLFAMNLALARGLNPDHPEGLHKVTETF